MAGIPEAPLPADVASLQTMVRELQAQAALPIAPRLPVVTEPVQTAAAQSPPDAVVSALREMVIYHHGTVEERAAQRERFDLSATEMGERVEKDAKKALDA